MRSLVSSEMTAPFLDAEILRRVSGTKQSWFFFWFFAAVREEEKKRKGRKVVKERRTEATHQEA